MLTDIRRAHRAATAILLAAGVAACDDPLESPVEPQFGMGGGSGEARTVDVYAQNMYLGGDTGPILSVDFNDIAALMSATYDFWTQVESSNVPDRVAAIADQIDRRRPHVVALQEVFRFILRDGAFQEIGRVDLLELLEAEIAARGLPYATAVTQEATASMLPMAPGGGGVGIWLDFADRIATLHRTDVDVAETDGANYAVALDLGPVVLKRGWTRTTFEHAGTTHHLINTHLEIGQLAPIQVGQALELEHQVVAGLDGVTIIAGDLNSNAAAPHGDPSRTPTYDNLIAAGFIDVRDASPPANRDDGLTCCHDRSLTGEPSFDQRIDFVLVRASGEAARGWADMRGGFRYDVVGEEDADKSSTGLWPSDHAGVIGSLRLPAGMR